jgi:alanine racemase
VLSERRKEDARRSIILRRVQLMATLPLGYGDGISQRLPNTLALVVGACAVSKSGASVWNNVWWM